MNSRIAVVGGGLAGLETANALVSPDTEVTIFETGDAVRTEHMSWDTNRYPGDSSVQTWTGENWGKGGGLKQRLGGRSLCYHGVMLELDDETLTDWPSGYARRLTQPDGLYDSTREDLAAEFPNMNPHPLPDAASTLGLQSVPQAAYFDRSVGRLRAYTPLTRTRQLLDAHSRSFRLVQGTAQRVTQQREGEWAVETIDTQGDHTTVGAFDACVLAASAIGNAQLLARSLDTELQTPITDHFGIGALLRVAPSRTIGLTEHSQLWAGYIPLPDISANVFIGETQVPGHNDHILDISAVIEQSPSDYSTLTVTPDHTDGFPRSHIKGNVSSADQERIVKTNQFILKLTKLIVDRAVTVVPTWYDYDIVYRTLTQQAAQNSFAYYKFPYGSFEHEACTHPIGNNGAFTISEQLEVEDMPGIFAVGPGSFPRLGRANPALTILTMARGLAQDIKTRHNAA